MPYVAKKTIEEYLNDIKGTDTKQLAQEINKAIYNYTGYKDNLKETKSIITKEDMPDFAELLHAIREKLIDLDEKGQIKHTDDLSSKYIKSFMYNPIKLLNASSTRVINYCEKWIDNVYEEQNKILKIYAIKNYLIRRELKESMSNYERILKEKGNRYKDKIDANAAWFDKYFNNGKDNIKESLEQNKGGYFENLFKTTSKEYKEFSRRLNLINKDNAEKGDLSGLRKSAFDYLKHKFPNDFKVNGNEYTFDETKIAKLDKTGQGRALLCLNVIKNTYKAENMVSQKKDPNTYVADNNIKPIDNNIIKDSNAIGQMQNEIVINKDYFIEDDINKIEFTNEIKNATEDNIQISNNEIKEENINVIENELNNE